MEHFPARSTVQTECTLPGRLAGPPGVAARRSRSEGPLRGQKLVWQEAVSLFVPLCQRVSYTGPTYRSHLPVPLSGA